MKNRVKKATAAVVLSVFTATCAVPAFAGQVDDLRNSQQQINAEKAGVQCQLKERRVPGNEKGCETLQCSDGKADGKV